MIEILILYILYSQKNTLYGIRKVIKDKYLHLSSATFGSIHPAVSRLIEKGFITEKKLLSDGGRKKNIYSLTKEGKNYVLMSLKADFSAKNWSIEKQISTKLACCDILDIQFRKELYTKVTRYYEYKIVILSNMLKNNTYNSIQKGQLETIVENYKKEIEFLRNFLD